MQPATRDSWTRCTTPAGLAGLPAPRNPMRSGQAAHPVPPDHGAVIRRSRVRYALPSLRTQAEIPLHLHPGLPGAGLSSPGTSALASIESPKLVVLTQWKCAIMGHDECLG